MLKLRSDDRREIGKPAEGGTFVLGPNGSKVKVPELGALEHADPAIRGPAEAQMALANAAAEAHQAEQIAAGAVGVPRSTSFSSSSSSSISGSADAGE